MNRHPFNMITQAVSRGPALVGVMALVAFLFSFSGCRTSVPVSTTAQTGAAAPHSYPEQGEAPRPFGAVGPDGSQSPTTPVTFDTRPDPEPVAQSRQPNIAARAAILVDNRGRVVFEKNASARVPTASTQKLLLGILIVEAGNLGKTITVQDSDTWADFFFIVIDSCEIYTREELLRAVLIRSSNDIARCLARDHSGSVAAFAARMNARARQLGMNNSYFTNASGLPTPSGQYSTARDMAILGAAAMQKPFIRSAVGTRTHLFRFSNGTTKTVTNTNRVLGAFPYCTGAKTGYTNAAGRCLISSASHGGKSCIAVVLGSTSANVWRESEELLRLGLGM